MTTPKPWTDVHRREAWSRIFALTAELLAARSGPLRATLPRLDPAEQVETEAMFRTSLARFPFDGARIDREVRRVRGLAEGRLVRDEHYRVGVVHYDDYSEAADEAVRFGVPVVTVRRIRRAR